MTPVGNRQRSGGEAAAPYIKKSPTVRLMSIVCAVRHVKIKQVVADSLRHVAGWGAGTGYGAVRRKVIGMRRSMVSAWSSAGN